MPYIPTGERRHLDHNYEIPKTPGALNYLITSLVDAYAFPAGVSYTRINEVIGVLECAKLELYRRIAAPYEDKKCRENGDVYTFESRDAAVPSNTRVGEDGKPIPQQLQDDVDVLDRAQRYIAEVVGNAYTRPTDMVTERGQALAHHDTIVEPTDFKVGGVIDADTSKALDNERLRMERIAMAARRAHDDRIYAAIELDHSNGQISDEMRKTAHANVKR